MNCSLIRERLVEIFDLEPDIRLRGKFLAHFDNCLQCKTEYRESCRILHFLEPSFRVFASPGFKRCLQTEVFLDVLPEAQAEVIRLRTRQKLSFSAIAEKLDLPAGTIKTHFSDGLNKLRMELPALGEVDR